MKIPENLKYTNDHEWIRVEGLTAYVGITDYAQDQLGEIIFVDVAAEMEGEIIERQNVFGSIEAVKTVSDLLAPVDGKVLEVNKNLENQPEKVNSDPYGEGWIIQMEILKLYQLDELMTAAQYCEFTAQNK
ncbi:MAG: glycine cleavage system protein GcvH [Candidatus Azobacteroides sp.]|nr:glycine cleavage system protein GcvH [Candidatus Azobacteroides sp.]